jgi:folate-binding Fe-S cluster repair protein YgfZ
MPTMMRFLVVLAMIGTILLAFTLDSATAFVPHRNLPLLYTDHTTTKSIVSPQRLSPWSSSSSSLSSTDFDYEYIPPNPDVSPGPPAAYFEELATSYPAGTPAGLRGEAIRSALLSHRCIGWDLSAGLLSMGGVLQIRGRGTLAFLNNKLTQQFGGKNANAQAAAAEISNSFQEACLLDAKGRLVDWLRVAVIRPDLAYVLTSPGHSSQDLLKRLDPFVFPLDEVELSCYNSEGDRPASCFTYTLMSTQFQDIQKVIKEQASLPLSTSSMVFPGTQQSVVWSINDGVQILVVPSTGLPPVAGVGYTFVFFGSNGEMATQLGRQTWQRLISELNSQGPIEVGAREYETLRIEAGQPAYGLEFGRALTATLSPSSDDVADSSSKAGKENIIKTSPLELHWKSTLNLDKGCYLGQEGIASVLKNPRGPPRTLYSVVFDDDFNTYETQSRGDSSDIENLTVLPRPGQTLYALGSNEKLMVGSLTSVGEAGGTGDRETVALALVKRADSIQKQMKEMELEISRDMNDFFDINAGSGMIQPPPMDPLDGLEVIVEGTFTVGVLKCIPSRRGIRRDGNMFDDKVTVEGFGEEDPILVKTTARAFQEEAGSTATLPSSVAELDDSATLEEIQAEAAKAAAEAEAAASEAKRKAEKLEMLKKRAEEAMARRKGKGKHLD